MPHSIRSNIAVLAAVQAAEYAAPLLAIPLLIASLGIGEYGKIAFAQAIGYYILILCDFGFGMSGTHAAAISKHDRTQLTKLFWDVQFSKISILFCVAPALILVTMAFDLGPSATIVLCSLLIPLGSLFYPQWFLLGIEQIRVFSLVVVCARLSALGLIYFVVGSPADVVLAALLLFGAMPIAGLVTLVIIFSRRTVGWHFPRARDVFAQISSSRHAFYATASSSLYRMSNPIVLGIVSTPSEVGYYTVAEKIVKAIQEINRPISLASYPRISALASQSSAAAIALLKTVLIYLLGIGAACSAFLWLFSGEIARLVAKDASLKVSSTLSIMAIVPLIGGASLAFGGLSMLPLGRAKEFARCILLTGIFSLCLIFPLASRFGAIGAGIAFAVSEGVLLLQLVLLHRRHNLIRWV